MSFAIRTTFRDTIITCGLGVLTRLSDYQRYNPRNEVFGTYDNGKPNSYLPNS